MHTFRSIGTVMCVWNYFYGCIYNNKRDMQHMQLTWWGRAKDVWKFVEWVRDPVGKLLYDALAADEIQIERGNGPAGGA
eukprot:scaffold87281_cov36-Prasinocladus_malaysianus.AAC.3